MACFLVTAVEAAAVTAIAQVIAAKAKKDLGSPVSADHTNTVTENSNTKLGFAKKLMWLANLLWGGAFLLAFEHVWHGEVTAWFPFLTAAATPETTSVMLHEMATVGVMMSVLVTAVWVVMLAVSKSVETKAAKEAGEVA